MSVVLIYRDFYAEIRDILRKLYPDMGEKDFVYDSRGVAEFTFRTFALASIYGKKPGDIYNEISRSVGTLDFVSGVKEEKGYINISIKPARMLKVVSDSINSTGSFPDTFQDPERVNVEHTSTNPTGPIHVGRARNSIIGDSVARLLSRYGYRVSTQYFVNDSGKQVIALYEGFNRFFKGSERDIKNLLAGYQMIYQKMDELGGEEKVLGPLIRRYESGDSDFIESVKSTAAVVLLSIKDSLLSLGIRIDDFVWESGFLKSQEMEQVFSSLDPYLKDDNGAKYILLDKPEKSADPATEDHERRIYLRRSDGTSLYFARDLAYHLFKGLNADWIIDVLGEDHRDHGAALKMVLKDMMDFGPRIDFIFYGFVTLDSGKLSTRKGNIITLDDLVARAREEAMSVVAEKRKDLDPASLSKISNAVAISSIRFNIMRINADKHMVFRWEEALNIEGDSAPYIMYAYARASSILRSAGDFSLDPDPDAEFDIYETALIRNLYFFPRYLSDAVRNLRPELIASYCLSLVRTFNDFYTNCRILGQPEKIAHKRLILAKTFNTVLADAANIIGIKLMEEM